ncbi:MAG TPA: DUF1559 domain-containing protein [Pirellulales bacterium]|nr:DUF1559 domain-containing protein [Pirellulales bacterium]
MANFKRAKRARRGFTMIELLVIVSVIGLLFALLLPALQSARESTRRTTCQSNLRQQGQAMSQFEQSRRRFPSGGEGTDLTQQPPATAFDVPSTFSQILPYLDDEIFFTQPLNLEYAYNDAACPVNQVVSKVHFPEFLCPSNALRPADPSGYGLTDYMPAVYTDIDPASGIRNPMSRKNGALRLGGTQAAQISDGLSRTIAVVEDAGRTNETTPPSMTSPYPDPIFSGGAALVWNGAKQVSYTQWLMSKQLVSGGLPSGDGATPSGHRAMNRWAEPASGGGISGQANSTTAKPVRAINGNRFPLGGPPDCLWSVANCGPNQEAWSWHTGGANSLYCDGSVRSIGDAIDPRVLRMLITADEQDIYDDKQVPN